MGVGSQTLYFVCFVPFWKDLRIRHVRNPAINRWAIVICPYRDNRTLTLQPLKLLKNQKREVIFRPP